MLPCSAPQLRRDLNARATVYARQHGLLHDFTTGRDPSVIFGVDDGGRHGNFHPASYRAILAEPDWSARLGKAHTANRRAFPRADWSWRELDCAASSDALLMNVFCHPGTLRSFSVQLLLGIEQGTKPRFGVHPRLERTRGLIDMTEIDMELGELLVEAKLTEGGFTPARPALLDRYPRWREIFDESALPRTENGSCSAYQLVRGVLAAEESGGSFCLLADARRPDLLHAWQSVIGAVGRASLRCRLKMLTWQELAAPLPDDLRSFLREKYGIEPAS